MALAALLCLAASAQAQNFSDTLVTRALELEAGGKVREAATLYRRALGGSDVLAALLGLERAYAELGMTDSLVAPMGAVIERMPADGTARSVQLRTLHALRRGDAVRSAAHDWMRAAPHDPSPYRELARLLLVDGRPLAADSVVTLAQRTLGATVPLAREVAQIRAAAARWEESAVAWRAAFDDEPWLTRLAADALTPTPAPGRDAVRAVFMRAPVHVAARLALAGLETRWGSAGLGWAALGDLPADSVSAAAWIAFGEMAEADARWAQARTAFEAALRWRDDAPLRIRAASAALASGDPVGAMRLAPIAGTGGDSAHLATEVLPLHATALGALGRAEEAERLVTAFDRFLAPGARGMLARVVAMGWVRAGDLPRARTALRGAGEHADSSAAAGWIALYEGDARTARALLGRGEERSAEVALALAVLARFRDPRAPEVGEAFLTLARGDSGAAARAFVRAAAATPRAASVLLLAAAGMHVAARDTAAAAELWERVAREHPESAEAPEALLHAARSLLRRGDRAGAAARLERLVLAYPASALVPVARRELELVNRDPAPGR